MTIKQFLVCVATQELIKVSFQKESINAYRKRKRSPEGSANKDFMGGGPYSHDRKANIQYLNKPETETIVHPCTR